MKKHFKFSLNNVLRAACVASLFMVFGNQAQAQFSGGSGISSDPYQISTAVDLAALADSVNAGNNFSLNKYFALTNDIDLGVAPYNTGSGWEPIGIYVSASNFTQAFQGTFDGDGYIVKNLFIDRFSGDYQGLFGIIESGAVVKNLGLENCNITAGGWSGCLVGYSGSSSVENCYTTGTIIGYQYVGGLIGYNYGSTTLNCYSTVNTTGGNYTGGLVGNNYSSSDIANCYASGRVKGSSNVGGIAGGNNSNVRNCVAANDTVSGTGGSISRVIGYWIGGNLNYNYALDSMRVNNATASGLQNNVNGAGIDLDSVISFGFYANAGRWSTTAPAQLWSIDKAVNPAKAWNICDGMGLPFLQWENTACPVPIVFCGGQGTQADPYQICDAQTLKNLADSVNAGGNWSAGKYFILTNDIDLDIAPYNTGAGWTPIGTGAAGCFQGNFDGNGFVVKNLYINDPSTTASVGLFGCIEDNTIINLGVVDCDLTGDGVSVGGLVGENNNSYIANCYVTGKVTGTQSNYAGITRIGGLVGWNYSSGIFNCYSTATVTAKGMNTRIGGLVGNNVGYSGVGYSGSTVSNCYATGKVDGAYCFGGVVGYNGSVDTIRNCVAANDTITGGSGTNIYRIAGYNTGGTMQNNYANRAMVVLKNGTPAVVTPNINAESGADTTLTAMKDFNFYNDNINWNSAAYWSIDQVANPAKAWNICDGSSLPYLQWEQGVVCLNDITADFIDASLLEAVRTIVGKASPAPIYDTDVDAITRLDISGLGIAHLNGLSWFTALEWLDCSNNDLTALTNFPAALTLGNEQFTPTLTYINCSGNQIDAMHPLPANLEYFDCSSNQIANLPNFPGTLTYLDCSNNQVAALPNFPTTLTYLDCSNNLLPGLPILPDLDTLKCGNNLLPGLPNFPTTLTYLDCSHNLLPGLPMLTDLTYLDCSYNLLTGTPAFPGNLEYLDISHNLLTGLQLMIGLNKLEYFNCSYNQLDALQTLPGSISTMSGVLKTLDCSHNLFVGNKITIGHISTSTNMWVPVELPNTLTSLNCAYNFVTAIDVQGLVLLSDLDCRMNYLALDSSTVTGLNTSLTTTLNFNPQRHTFTINEPDHIGDNAWGSVNRDERHEIAGSDVFFTQSDMTAFWLGDSPAGTAAMARYIEVDKKLGVDFDRIRRVHNGVERSSDLIDAAALVGQPDLVYVSNDTTYIKWAIYFADSANGLWTSRFPTGAAVGYKFYLNDELVAYIPVAKRLPNIDIWDGVVRNMAQLNSTLADFNNGSSNMTMLIGASFDITNLLTVNSNGYALTIKSYDPFSAGDRYTLTRDIAGNLFTISNNSTLTLENIIIDGNIATPAFASAITNGSLVHVGVSNSHGTLNMHADAVLQNNFYNINGAGVYIDSAGTFNMTGGEIKNNRADGSAGGVYIQVHGGTFTMTGGEIKNNRCGGSAASYAGGVHFPGGSGGGNVFTLGGTAKIYDNYKGSTSLVENNVYVGAGRYITLGTSGDAPASTMMVYITKTANSGIFVNSGGNTTNVHYFAADEPTCIVKNSTNQLQIECDFEISIDPYLVTLYDTATVGYAPRTPQTVTVRNEGAIPTGNLLITISGDDAANFSLSANAIYNINVLGDTSFAVVPNTGLAAGTYNAYIVVRAAAGNLLTRRLDFSFTVEPQLFCGGSGTKADPYQICDAQALKDFADSVNAGTSFSLKKYFILTDNIDLNVAPYNTGTGWESIGLHVSSYDHSKAFQGYFDGNGKTINNLFSIGQGLFDYGYGDTIVNLGLVNCNIIDGIGTLIAENDHGFISNCYATGTISTTGNGVGGLVGLATTKCVIENCYASVDVSGGGASGLVAVNKWSDIRNCYATGNINSTGNWAAGLVGVQDEHATISNCYTTGNVSSTGDYTGGLVGLNANYSTVENCYATGKISGNDYTGGLVGQNIINAEITNCVAANDSIFGTNANRIVGDINTGTFTNNYANDNMKVNNLIVTTGTHNNENGGDQTLATLTTYGFYVASGNWNISVWSIIDIADPSAIWRICPTGILPYLQWEAEKSCPAPSLCGTGSGTLLDPYIICDAATLDAVRTNSTTLSQHYKLGCNIDLTAYLASGGAGYGKWGTAGWLPIGTSANRFIGSLDGDGYEITGLVIDRPSMDYVGLFGYVGSSSASGTLRNIGIADCSVNGQDVVGGLVGALSNHSAVENCYVTGAVSGNSQIGGIAGQSYSYGTITNCYSTADISGNNRLGGIIGFTDDNVSISYCYATGTISGTTAVGGIAGYNKNSSISNCVVANAALSGSLSNRIVGDYQSGTLTNNYAYKQMTINASAVTSGSHSVPHGKDTTLKAINSFDFYGTTGNWNTAAWDIDYAANNAKIWQICPYGSLPYFQWQQSIVCQSITITVEAGENGVIAPSGNITAFYADDTTFTFTPNTGYHIDSVYINNVYNAQAVSAGFYRFLEIKGDSTIKVTFAIDTFNITATATANGSISPNNVVKVTYGSSQRFEFTPNTGYHLDSVFINNVYNAAATAAGEYTFADVRGDSAIKATFAIDTFNITTTATANGNISPSNVVKVTYGSSQRIEFTPNTGYHIDSVYINDVYNAAATAAGEYTFSNVTGDSAVKVVFSPIFCGGTGTTADPYRICTAKQLNAVRDFLGSHFILNDNIDLTAFLSDSVNGWLPIGTVVLGNRFEGTFNGQGHVITGLWIDRPAMDYVGLFGYIYNGAKIDSLGVEIAAAGVKGQTYVGGLVGFNYSYSTISNCYAKGNVSGNSRVGGLVGSNNWNAVISNCYFTGNVTGNNWIGGLVGVNTSSGTSISNCYATGKVSGTGETAHVGGLVGSNEGSAVISNCVAANDSIKGTTANRIAGANSTGASISNCYANQDMIINNVLFAGTAAHNNVNGADKTLATLKTFAFYSTTTSEWTAWDIDEAENHSVIWRICPAGSLPFFQWEKDVVCPPPYTFCGGTGTTADPYQICTAAQLDSVRYFLSSNFVLNNDIDLEDYLSIGDGFNQWGTDGWLPIGTVVLGNRFEGTFNGQGHVITGLWIDRPAMDYVGLFGVVYGATAKIDSLGVEIAAAGVKGNNNVGGLVGYSYSGSIITNCYATGNVSGYDQVGGLAGLITSSTVSNCYATGNVSGNNWIGGLVGYNISAISNCYATGKVSGSSGYVGGLVGGNAGTITNCVAANDSITCATNTNRIVGIFISGAITNCYANEDMKVNNVNVTGVHNDANGADQSLATLKTFAFYNTTSNWNGSEWNIAPNASAIWRICDGLSLPLFQWQKNEVITTIVSVGPQSAMLLCGKTDSVTFAITTGNIPDGTYPVTELYGIGMSGMHLYWGGRNEEIVITNNTGTLTVLADPIDMTFHNYPFGIMIGCATAEIRLQACDPAPSLSIPTPLIALCSGIGTINVADSCGVKASAGCNLVWYNSAGQQIPAPTSFAAMSNGITTFYVSQQRIGNTAVECEAPRQTVTVSVGSSEKPKVRVSKANR